MNPAEFLCDLATCPPSVHELKDEKMDRGRPPTHPIWRENVFIITRGLAPLAVQQLAYWAYPSKHRIVSELLSQHR